MTQAAEQVRSTLAQAVTAETHGEDRPGSSGLAIYFPNSAEYVGTFGEWTINYPSSIGRFATASLWDDYLTFHYTGEAFDAGNADVAVLTPAQSTRDRFHRRRSRNPRRRRTLRSRHPVQVNSPSLRSLSLPARSVPMRS